MSVKPNSQVLSSEDIKNLMLNMEKESEILDAARKPLLIMLTDLVNSTVYYDRLGDVAAKSIIFKHNNILFPIIESQQGTVIKTTGDGILAIFNIANDGIAAAIRIQQELKVYNLDRDPESTITVRIGMHYGKTIVFENDVYGDTINATSRIEALGDGSEIMISENVVQAAQMQEEQLVNIGLVHLKGKLEPVNVYGLVWDTDDAALRKAYQEKRIQNQQKGVKSSETIQINLKGELEYDEQESAIHKERSNPFLNRSAITQPEYFYGRDSLIHKVYSRLSAQRPQSVSLFGERRIGKSSLLNQLRSLRLRRQFLTDVNRFIFIYIDVQSMRSATVEHFIQSLFDGVRACFSGQISFTLTPVYQNFAKLVEELNRADISIVIMFDEFDLITLNPNFDVEFYSWLRSLASHYKVAFLTSSLSQLHQLCASKKISDSPFFNIFTAFHVGAFSRSEVETMVRGLLDLSLMEYSFDAWMDEIIAQAGFIPFFIQIYCANLFDLFPTQPSASEVAEAFREEAKDHFEHIRRNLSPDETECLQLIIANKKIPAKLDAVLQLMIRKGYVLADNGNYRLFSAAFDSFYRQYSLSKTGKTFWSKLWKK